MAEIIVQTAGRAALGEFSPEFAHYNDDILFGENRNNQATDILLLLKKKCGKTPVLSLDEKLRQMEVLQ